MRQVPILPQNSLHVQPKEMIQLLFVGAAIYLLTRQDPTIRRIKEALDEWEPEGDGDWRMRMMIRIKKINFKLI